MFSSSENRVTRDSNVPTLDPSKAVRKFVKLILLLSTILICTTGFGVYGTETHMPFDINEEVSLFIRHNKDIEKMIANGCKNTRSVTEKLKVLEKENADLKKEVDSLSSQIASDISEAVNAQVLAMKQQMERAKNASQNKLAESLTTTTQVISKLSGCKSKIEEARLQNSEKTYAGPSFSTSQFGYKMQVFFVLNGTELWIELIITPGEYDNLLKWPFMGNVKFILFDQSEQSENIVRYYDNDEVRKTGCWTRREPPTTPGQMECYHFIANSDYLEVGKHCGDNSDTLYIGIEVETEKIYM